jgi:hypothetical protein
MTQNQRLPTTNGDFEALKRQVEALERIAARRLVPIVATLPASPSVDDECVFIANAVWPILWPLRYIKDGSGYGWKSLGGPPLTAYNPGAGPTAVGAGVWQSGAGGALLTVPAVGDYIIKHSVSMWSNSALGTVMYSAVMYSNASVLQSNLLQNQTPGTWLTGAIVDELQTGVPTGSLEQVFNVGVASTMYIGFSRLSINPVRLAG